MTNNTENSGDVVDIVDNAFGKVLETAKTKTTYSNPEEYRKATGKRFRVTKEELEKYGSTDEGRQNAFLARNFT